MAEPESNASALTCGFCGKTPSEVPQFFAGPRSATICSECVGVLMNILASQYGDYFEELVQRARTDKLEAFGSGSGEPSD